MFISLQLFTILREFVIISSSNYSVQRDSSDATSVSSKHAYVEDHHLELEEEGVEEIDAEDMTKEENAQANEEEVELSPHEEEVS